MKKLTLAALAGCLLLLVLLGSDQVARAEEVTVWATRDDASDCDAECCPSQVQVDVDVDPTTGLWTAQVKGTPVGANPSDPPVPLPCGSFSLRERTVTIRKVGQDPPTETPGPWESVPPAQGQAGAGQTNGTSSRLVDGAHNSTVNDTGGTDVDVRIEFELTINIPCAVGGGCEPGNCVYKAKWYVSYDDGSASVGTGP